MVRILDAHIILNRERCEKAFNSKVDSRTKTMKRIISKMPKMRTAPHTYNLTITSFNQKQLRIQKSAHVQKTQSTSYK